MQFPHLGQRPVARFTGHYQSHAKNNPPSSTETEEKESKDGVLFLYGAPIPAIPKAESTETSKPSLVQYPSLASLLSALKAAENKPAESERPISIEDSSPGPKEPQPQETQEHGWLDFFGAQIRPVQKTPDTTTPEARTWIPYPSLHQHHPSTKSSRQEAASEPESSHKNTMPSQEAQAQEPRPEKPMPFYGAHIPAIVKKTETPAPAHRFQYPSLRQFLDS